MRGFPLLRLCAAGAVAVFAAATAASSEEAPKAGAAAPAAVAAPAPAPTITNRLTDKISDKLSLHGAWRSRLEVWNFFEPAAAGNNTYDFVGTDLRINAAWTDDWFDAVFEGQAVGLIDLPAGAMGASQEGPLGLGAVYRAQNGDESTDGNAFVRQGFVKLKRLGLEGLSLKGGRFLFSEGKEAAVTEPSLVWLQNSRVAERLIGPFDFSYSGRSFDGATVAYSHGPVAATAMYSVPTQGGFATEANKHINDIDLAYGSVALTQPSWAPSAFGRLFYIYYADDRELVVTDNRPMADRQADARNIHVHTVGANWVHLVPTPAGPVDLLGWGAYQSGDWESLDHSAWAMAAEIGWQPKAPWKPWLRVGYNRSSGDDDAGDDDHGTFFQLLPTGRIYSMSTFYNLMNNEDIFAQLLLRPIPGLMWRTDLHVVRLTEGDDLWYFGAGATLEDEQPGIGFSSRPSGGDRSLMEVLETQVSYNWNAYVATTFYYAHAFGEDVVDDDFSGNDADYAFFELVLKL